VVLFFLVVLFLLLIIPGIIFMVFWLFAFVIFILEKESIFNSLGKSFDMLRGRWWRTFGYLIVLVLAFIVLTIPFEIISYVVGSLNIGLVGYYINYSISFFVDFLIAIFGTAFVVEYYIGLKKG
jgi:hypothetical protein